MRVRNFEAVSKIADGAEARIRALEEKLTAERREADATIEAMRDRLESALTAAEKERDGCREKLYLHGTQYVCNAPHSNGRHVSIDSTRESFVKVEWHSFALSVSTKTGCLVYGSGKCTDRMSQVLDIEEGRSTHEKCPNDSTE